MTLVAPRPAARPGTGAEPQTPPGPSPRPVRPDGGDRAVPWLARTLRRRLLARLSGLDTGGLRLVEEHSGQAFTVGSSQGGAGRVPTITVRTPAFYADVALGGTIGAAESYAAGRWDCDDLPALVACLVRHRDVLDGLEGGWARLSRPLHRLVHAVRPNTRRGSRRNIAAHYDLGRDFFRLWLDETMTYSCGLFERPDATLREASVAKLDRLCRKLDLRPGDRLLEIGCGWGSLALHVAARYGCHVTATTISEEQHALATERVAAAGLGDRVTVLREDYRDLEGRWDKLASVEMIEAVGADHLDEYVAACARLLERHGLFALQAITIADQHYERARDSVDFIKRHVFPGSFIPSVTAIVSAATRRSDLRLVHLEDMAPHYARTLACWRTALRSRWEEARALGYGEAFLRMWEYYLAYCEGGFAERSLGVSQMLLVRPGCRRAPILPALDESPP